MHFHITSAEYHTLGFYQTRGVLLIQQAILLQEPPEFSTGRRNEELISPEICFLLCIVYSVSPEIGFQLYKLYSWKPFQANPVPLL